MTRAFIGLGSNLGDRLEHLRRAVASLRVSAGTEVVRASPVYETVAVGPPQPDFLNAVLEIETTLEPPELLDRLKSIERELGRRAREPQGPREIDLDLLLYGEEQITSESLTVPHPRMTERGFVLVPLADLSPSGMVPGAGTVSRLLASLGRSGVRPAFGVEALEGRNERQLGEQS